MSRPAFACSIEDNLSIDGTDIGRALFKLEGTFVAPGRAETNVSVTPSYDFMGSAEGAGPGSPGQGQSSLTGDHSHHVFHHGHHVGHGQAHHAPSHHVRRSH